ncbi:MAG: sn-glycerol-3-phosphate ABC transporter substrate-binding protein UgpB [Lautropia sp.]
MRANPTSTGSDQANASRRVAIARPARVLVAASIAAACAGFTGAASAQTEIQFWHAMTGALGERVGGLVDRFNASQKDYKVVAVFKGSYPETLAAAIAAARAGSAPHIVQVFEVGTATMMSAKGAIKPVGALMKEAGEKFSASSYVPAVAGYYTTSKGEMLSLPFNSSTTVFYYNKDALKKAGVDKVPETWTDVAAAAAKVKASNAASCGYTTGWQSWVQLENFSAWHNAAFATGNNGFDSTSPKLTVDTPLNRRHIGNLAQWAKDGLFTYAGRKNEAEAKFFSGDCAMLTSSSAAYANIKKNAKFDFGIGKLPYYADVPGAPQNTIIGGASLWVMAGKPAASYKGVAKFFTFLSQTDVQSEWHQATGYLPITMAAYDATKQSGFYEKNPGTDVSVQQMIVKTTDRSRGIRLGNFVQIRDVIDQELENVWSGKQSAAEGLKNIETRGNELLARFARTAKQ